MASRLSSNELLFANSVEGFAAEHTDLHAKLTASSDAITFSGYNGTGESEITLSGIRVSSAPTHDDHPASKSYVDKRAAGLDPKESVRYASSATFTSTNADVDKQFTYDRVSTSNESGEGATLTYHDVASSVNAVNLPESHNPSGTLTDGSYTMVTGTAVSPSSGTGALFNVLVSSGAVTRVLISRDAHGVGFAAEDEIDIDISGFSTAVTETIRVTVASVQKRIDTDFTGEFDNNIPNVGDRVLMRSADSNSLHANGIYIITNTPTELATVSGSGYTAGSITAHTFTIQLEGMTEAADISISAGSSLDDTITAIENAKSSEALLDPLQVGKNSSEDELVLSTTSGENITIANTNSNLGLTDNTYDSAVTGSLEFTRATDADSVVQGNNELTQGAFVFVETGDTMANSGFVCSSAPGEFHDGTDMSAHEIEFVQFSGAGQLSANDGIDLNSGVFSLGIDGLASLSNSEAAENDLFVVHDADAEANKQITLANVAAKLAGENGGLSASSGVLSLDISAFSESLSNTTVADADVFAIYDTDGSATKTITLANVAAKLAGENGGLSASSGVLSLDISAFSESLSNSEAAENDVFAIYDTDGSATKTITLANVAAKLAGTGISASSGVLSLQHVNNAENDDYSVLFSAAEEGTDMELKSSASNFTFNPNSGNLSVTTVTCSSDITLKKNIRTIEGGLDKVNQIRPIEWNWREEANGDTTSTRMGVSAQQLQKILPDSVVKGSNGNLAVVYNDLIGVLISSIQELSKKVDELEQ